MTGVEARMRYTNMSVDAYTETNAGTGSLSVEEQDSDSISASLGGTMRYNAGKLRPYLNLFYEYNKLYFGDTNVGLVVAPSLRSIQDAGSNSDDYISFDAGLDYFVTDDVVISSNYMTSFLSSDIDHHSISLSFLYLY